MVLVCTVGVRWLPESELHDTYQLSVSNANVDQLLPQPTLALRNVPIKRVWCNLLFPVRGQLDFANAPSVSLSRWLGGSKYRIVPLINDKLELKTLHCSAFE
jgi:hypothetical protein